MPTKRRYPRSVPSLVDGWFAHRDPHVRNTQSRSQYYNDHIAQYVQVAAGSADFYAQDLTGYKFGFAIGSMLDEVTAPVALCSINSIGIAVSGGGYAAGDFLMDSDNFTTTDNPNGTFFIITSVDENGGVTGLVPFQPGAMTDTPQALSNLAIGKLSGSGSGFQANISTSNKTLLAMICQVMHDWNVTSGADFAFGFAANSDGGWNPSMWTFTQGTTMLGANAASAYLKAPNGGLVPMLVNEISQGGVATDDVWVQFGISLVQPHA